MASMGRKREHFAQGVNCCGGSKWKLSLAVTHTCATILCHCFPFANFISNDYFSRLLCSHTFITPVASWTKWKKKKKTGTSRDVSTESRAEHSVPVTNSQFSNRDATRIRLCMFMVFPFVWPRFRYSDSSLSLSLSTNVYWSYSSILRRHGFLLHFFCKLW